MEIDNLKHVLPFFTFTSEDDFYYLQILQRVKDNPGLGRNSRVVKNYYLTSQEQLIKKYEEIKDLCRTFNARASIRLNKRSFEKVGFKSMENMAKSMGSRDFRYLSKVYDRACGSCHNDPNKKWIVDIDDKWEEEKLALLETDIDMLEPLGSKIYATIPSKTGLHLITKPFNLHEFKGLWPEVDVHKDNPCNLYIP